MKKLIFVSLLLISSFVFASGNFTANNTYCVKPSFNDELVTDDGGRAIGYAQCYHKGQSVGPRIIFFEYLDPSTYYVVKYMESQYLYFKDNSPIYINDELTKAVGLGIEFWQYSGDFTFK